MKQAIIATNKLSKTFSNEGTQQHVLKNLDLGVYSRDFTVIMGPSGAGKSTLLYSLSGMDRPSLGNIVFDDRDISELSDDELAVFRRTHCGFVFQDIYLIESMSLMDNALASGLLVTSNRKELIVQAKNLFEQVGIDEGTWGKLPCQVSGGEAQRAGVVRALINRPQVLFADEPTGSLNSASGTAVLDAISAFNTSGQSVVMFTHDITSALRGNRILYMLDGTIHDELILSSYTEPDELRRETLHDFLAHMGW